jgi:predicted enzyme involved in methoxymalonyl-ACP biosynthesis
MERPVRAFVADARKVSGSDFVKAFTSQRSKLDNLCADLWQAAMDGDREKCAELRGQIQGRDEPLSELKMRAGWVR